MLARPHHCAGPMPARTHNRVTPPPSLLLLLALGGLGCAGLRLQMVDRSVQRPSNIAVYFTVDTSRGDPVPDLTPADFHIYEDGEPVSVFESQQTILQPEVAAAHFTLLLVDMSGSVVGSPDVDKVVAGAAAFAQTVGRYQKLGIYAFDGSPHVTQISPFGGGNPQTTLNAFAGFRPKDPSTNLNGAIIEAIKILDHQMRQSPVPLRFGTLVVFTDGTDRAARVSRDAVHAALGEVDFEVYAIAVGAEINPTEIGNIGRTGTFTSKNPADIRRGFEDIARRIEGFSRRYYLLSYCSPARAGQHDVEIEAVKGVMRGRLQYDFRADGFGPGCDPNRKPAFSTRHPRTRPLPEAKRASDS
ncbi:MAG: VWA domain-containing protein [Polyangia bacterium]